MKNTNCGRCGGSGRCMQHTYTPPSGRPGDTYKIAYVYGTCSFCGGTGKTQGFIDSRGSKNYGGIIVIIIWLILIFTILKS